MLSLMLVLMVIGVVIAVGPLLLTIAKTSSAAGGATVTRLESLRSSDETIADAA